LDEKKMSNENNSTEEKERKLTDDEKLAQKVDFDSIFDLKLTLSQYQEKLQNLLDNSGLGIVEQRKLFRQKSQEFKDEKRKPHHELEDGKKYY
jgi:hypothetical protein